MPNYMKKGKLLMQSQSLIHTIVQHRPSGGEAKIGHHRFYPLIAGYDGWYGHSEIKANYSLSVYERLQTLP